MNTKEAIQITHTLGKPSKMPGFTYGLPAQACKTGAKLAKIKGTTCHGCYALKGCYLFKAFKEAGAKRLEAIKHPLWAKAMAVQINSKKSKFFRWHDSGDIQSVKHLLKIFKVCKLTPDVKHWLPTREAGMLAKVPAARVPKNLIIRLSATKVDGKAAKFWPWTSTVSDKKRSTCPAPQQDNKCMDCRKCWSRKVKNIAYGKH